MRRFSTLVVALSCIAVTPAFADDVPRIRAIAEGHDSRIDLTWTCDAPDARYHIESAASESGPFVRRTKEPQDFAVFSDWIGAGEHARWYRIIPVDAAGEEFPPSETISAKTRPMSRDELLTSIQKAHFRYFWDFAHPVSGLTREGFRHKRDTCTSGGTGFGMITLMVGAERGFQPREVIAERLLKQVRFLQDKAQRYHGAWSHWINGATGETIAFAGPQDNGGDIVETAYVVQGMLTIRQYFDRDDAVERELRERIEKLWREVEWDWYRGDPPQTKLRWHWSPNHGFKRNHGFGGNFNECMITYIVGLASPTHPLPTECYHEGWAGKPKVEGDFPYANGETYHDIKLPVGWPYGGPLFFTQYSFLGLDPRFITDRYCNYYENNRAISLINRAHCIANPNKFKGYSKKAWGLTASFTPGGYHAHEPRHDNGTISPTAALAAMPYTPDESLAALEHFYRDYEGKLWGPLGFWDAFNPSKDWVSDTMIAIDQGPITPMIENARTQLCWRMFMKNEEIAQGLKRASIWAERPAKLVAPSAAPQ